MSMDSVVAQVASTVVALLSSLLFSTIESLYKKAKERWWWLPIVQYVATFAALSGAVAAAYSAGYIQRYMDSVAAGDIGAQVSATVLLLFIGWLLYLLREKERRIYALLELAIATVTAFTSLQKLNQWQQPIAWVPIAGAVYLVVRGLDNLAQGIKAARAAEEAAANLPKITSPRSG